MKRIVLLGYLVLLTSGIQAQQLYPYTLFRENQVIYNPANAGVGNEFNINLAVRKQWAQIEGSPLTMYASADFPIQRSNWGLGAFLLNDAAGPSGLTGIGFAANYQLLFDEATISGEYGYDRPDKILSIGLSTSVMQYRLDGTAIDLDDETDEFFLNKRGNRVMPDVAFGIRFQWFDRWHVGFSIPQLLSLNIHMESDGRIVDIRRAQHYLFHGAMSLGPARSWLRFEPALWVKYAVGAPAQGELSARLRHTNIGYLGVGYRTTSTLFFEGGLDIQGFRIGYAYDFPTSSLRPDLGQTHELFLSYRFQSRF